MITRIALGIAAVLVLNFGGGGTAAAGDLEILVAPKGSKAYAFAKSKADGKTRRAERKLGKALFRAAEHLNDKKSCGPCTVTVKVLGGGQKVRGGAWSVPPVRAEKARLRLLGGYNGDFSKRDPFANPTRLESAPGRSAAVLSFQGKKHALEELYISGFSFDVAAGNTYDKKSNGLRKDTSASSPILSFGYLTTNRLVIADNVFANAANGAAQPLIRAKSKKAEIVLRNNLFIGNVMAWRVGSASFRNIPARYLVEHNSFILNWPYNPDPTTSNPGTLEIGNKYSSKLIEIRGNLFAFNPGGAVFPQWDAARGPKMKIHGNLFWGNGALFKAKSGAKGALVGKFGSGRHAVFDPEELEDDFNWDSANNQAFDPGLTVQTGDPKAKPAAAAAPAPVKKADAPKPDAAMAELQALLANEGVADKKPAGALAVQASGPFQKLEFGKKGIATDIWAVRLWAEPGALPLPANKRAAAYGISPKLVEQFK